MAAQRLAALVDAQAISIANKEPSDLQGRLRPRRHASALRQAAHRAAVAAAAGPWAVLSTKY